jgi:hypothetical protein
LKTPKPEYSDDELSDLLDGIFDGSITEYDIPESLYFAIADYLKKGLYHGFGGSLEDFEGSKDLELLTELRENVYMFSAAKSFTEIKELRSMLIDDDGNLRDKKDFLFHAEQVAEVYNDAWARTEYHTAVFQAKEAVTWNSFEREKDIFPNLIYQTVGDACDICAPLDGLIAPVDDPIWNEIAPQNHFNCECVLLQEDEEKEITPKDEKETTFNDVTDKMSDVFKMNAGKDRYIFSPEHPYFSVDKKDRDFAKNNYGLSIPDSD